MLDALLSHIDTAAANGEPATEDAPAAEEPKTDDAEVAEVNTKKNKKRCCISEKSWVTSKNCTGKIILVLLMANKAGFWIFRAFSADEPKIENRNSIILNWNKKSDGDHFVSNHSVCITTVVCTKCLIRLRIIVLLCCGILKYYCLFCLST